ncbi:MULTISPECIES: preprotein translocase subunit SecY [Acidiplasma]|jgi:preprotein translocase subunit SecY|uniref:Protein translocase subunit SecY n=2 Tax=Acidiplasma TaxID=507753 RepID=A0A0Q0VPD6_9ARCH|nr:MULTISPECIES: preprotein translocase subunit SecY [Acidiplasma]KJE49452.1 preprotein translocase subunit SecY [Acidiplasma sp. MBA-1]KPV46383.1 preprotein translocase subunit SecY [Acidiplasma aeolicum]KQB35515.1 preprotein translocase subunit SecY [Acidiplasma cupricumulans]KQB36734.1 preprotein translocase subunit SecY [Acidiplasma aeolicum]WMT54573.1 MAG: preprotein translocase subunit SecY [Acidiplasma sp.]
MTEIHRNKGAAIPVIFVFAILLVIFYYFDHYTGLKLAIAGILVAPVFYIAYLLLSYTGPKKSRLYGLENLTAKLPAIKKPSGHVEFKYKMLWTVLIVLLYFVLTNVYIYGLNTKDTIDVFASFRAIFAGASGSLMDLGIGPIVTASIVMQLFAGAKIFNLDLTNAEDKAIYQGVQKLLVIIMIFVEAIPQAFGFLVPDASLVSNLNAAAPGYGEFLAQSIIVLQLFFGSYLVFLMDEVVSKYGIGSGISLFIAAGVSQQLFTGTFNWVPSTITAPLSVSNPPAGAIPKAIYLFLNSPASLTNTGMEQILFAQPNPMIALVGTLLIFFIVAYFQSSKIELPISHERVRGARGRYPLQLLYASNIPVILATALLANISMWTLLFWSSPVLSKIPILGHNKLLGGYPSATQVTALGISNTTPTSGLAYYLYTPNGLSDWLFPILEPKVSQNVLLGHTPIEEVIHVIVFMAFLVGFSILFAKFWIETTNMGAGAVARQIRSSGMQIPGFRRDPRVMEKVLSKYIPAITIFSGAIVGLLAGGADLIGTVGDTSGTGLLLAVGIVIQFYEAMGREQLMEMHPMIRQFFIGG